MKNILSIVLLLCVFCRVSAQINLPKISAKSPHAAGLEKFTDYPVSLHTGTVDISVPIYTIEAAGVKIPIELKYHSSGIRYDDCNREVGIGWTLFASGGVTYNQVGLPDGEFPTFIKHANSINPIMDTTPEEDTDIHKMINIEREMVDSEYDIFSYSFLGYSGKFFYPGTTTPIFTPRRNLKVSFAHPTLTGTMKFPVSITDEDGVRYVFTKQELPAGWSNPTTTLVLDSIISADKSDFVKFNYTAASSGDYGANPFYQQLVITSSNTYRDRTVLMEGGYPQNGHVSSGGYVAFQDFSYQRLDNITFKAGRVDFAYNSTNQLSSIKVFNNTDTQPIKNAYLYQSLFGINNDYAKLDSVQFRESGVYAPRTYSYKFEYNGVPFARKSGLDYWGYYNGTPFTGSYVPNFKIYVEVVGPSLEYQAGNADRNANDTAMLKGIISKVTYPTKGYSIFSFESHRANGGKAIGGARIKSITSYDAAGTLLGKKWYKYGVGESGDGLLYRGTIYPEDYCTTQQYETTEDNYIHIRYAQRERTYHSFPLFSNMGSGSPVVYGNVTEYNGDGINANGWTDYRYETSYPDEFYPVAPNGLMPMVSLSNNWRNGNLVYKAVHRQDGTLISKTINTYRDLNYQQYLCLKVQRFLDWPEMMTWNADGYKRGYEILQGWYNTPPLYGVQLMPYGPFSYANYYLNTGVRVLDSVVTMNDGVTTMTRYKYNSTYDKPDTVITRHGDGTFSVARMTYPFNKSGSVYTGMVAANIINPVIDQEEYKTSTANFLKSTTTDWDTWSGGFYKPKTVSTKIGTAAAEVRLRYSGYDSGGNVQTVAKEGGPKTTYIWSYKGTYPVAEIQNADYSTVEAALGGPAEVSNFRNRNPTDADLISFLGPLRTNPSLTGAMITTFTYQPLVGVTSTTDPKGMSTYYEYDGYGRLSVVRDKSGKIVKSICYNYKGEPTTNCYVPASRNIYAKIQFSNYTPGGTMPDYYTYADLTLKFYADEACTQPFTFTSATTITAAVKKAAFNDIDNTTTNTVTGSVSFTVAANQSSSAPVNCLTYHLYSYEYDGYYFGDTDNYSFTINTPTTGNLFVPVN